MNDIDREIKEVQLKREQLALEREIANERLKQRILSGPETLARTLSESFGRVKNSIFLWWKQILVVALIASVGLGGFAWLEHRQHLAAAERDRISTEQYFKRKAARIEAECGRFCFRSELGDYVSSNGGECALRPGFSHAFCELQAE